METGFDFDLRVAGVIARLRQHSNIDGLRAGTEASLRGNLEWLEQRFLAELTALAKGNTALFRPRRRISSTWCQNRLKTPSQSNQNYGFEIAQNYNQLATDINTYKKRPGNSRLISEFFARLQAIRYFVLREASILKRSAQLQANPNFDASFRKHPLSGGELFVKGRGDANDVDANDVFQVAANDCYFLAVLAGAIAKSEGPQFIKDRIVPEGENFRVRYGARRSQSTLVRPRFRATRIRDAVLQPNGSYAKPTRSELLCRWR